MRVCIAIGACVVRTTGAVTGGAWDGVAWLGIDEGYYRYFLITLATITRTITTPTLSRTIIMSATQLNAIIAMQRQQFL